MSAPRLFPTPRFGGTGATLTLGGRTYNVPASAKVRQIGLFAYVLDYGDLYLFTPKGEVEVPPQLAAGLIARYFDGQQDSRPARSGTDQ